MLFALIFHIKRFFYKYYGVTFGWICAIDQDKFIAIRENSKHYDRMDLMLTAYEIPNDIDMPS